MPSIEEQAPAKINLDLLITGRRPDGYHELDSLVVFGPPCDRLIFQSDERLSLDVAGPFAGMLAGEPDNLVLRAARRLAAEVGRTATGRITLEKRIPVAAGLGGGSSDAAATLRGLNRLWRLGMSAARSGAARAAARGRRARSVCMAVRRACAASASASIS